jgi:hypothetical protein
VSFTALEVSTKTAVSASTVPIAVSTTGVVSVVVVSVEVSPHATSVPRIATKRSFFIVFFYGFPFNGAYQKKVTPNSIIVNTKKTCCSLVQTTGILLIPVVKTIVYYC